jgi:hypothetical protein
MEQWWRDDWKGKTKVLAETSTQCHFIHYKSDMAMGMNLYQALLRKYISCN